MGLRDDKKARLRAQLYETAMDLFTERGFEETRVRDIYERVGVSEATFFNYFPTKESLLARSADESRYFYDAYLTHLVARPDEPVAPRIHELVQVVGSVFIADRARMAAVVGRTSLFYAPMSAPKDPAASDQDLASLDRMAELFRQGQRTGEIAADHNPLQIAELVTASMLQTITNWLLDWWEEDLGPRLAKAVDIVLWGVESDPRPHEVEDSSARRVGDGSREHGEGVG